MMTLKPLDAMYRIAQKNRLRRESLGMYSLHHLASVGTRPLMGARGLGMAAGDGVARPGGVTDAAMDASSVGLQPPYLGSCVQWWCV